MSPKAKRKKKTRTPSQKDCVLRGARFLLTRRAGMATMGISAMRNSTRRMRSRSRRKVRSLRIICSSENVDAADVAERGVDESIAAVQEGLFVVVEKLLGVGKRNTGRCRTRFDYVPRRA